MVLFNVLVILLSVFFSQLIHTESYIRLSRWNDTCPTESIPFSNVNFTEMDGVWYMYASIAESQRVNRSCTTLTITNNNGARTFVETSKNLINYQVVKSTGYFLRDYETNSVYSVFDFPLRYSYGMKFLNANFTEFMVLYACTPCGFFEEGGVHAYIYSRLAEPSCVSFDPILDVLQLIGINSTEALLIPQNNCSAVR